MREVTDLSPYRAAVVGTPVRAGQLNRDMPRFVAAHRQALSGMPVAYFVVCLTMSDPTEENCRTVEAYLDPVRRNVPEVKPVDVGLFAGAVLTEGEEYRRQFVVMRWVLKAMSKVGDVRDLDKIRAWGTQLRPKLLGTG